MSCIEDTISGGGYHYNFVPISVNAPYSSEVLCGGTNPNEIILNEFHGGGKKKKKKKKKKSKKLKKSNRSRIVNRSKKSKSKSKKIYKRKSLSKKSLKKRSKKSRKSLK